MESPIISEKLITSNVAYLASRELKALKHIVMKKDHGMPPLEIGLSLVGHLTVITLMKMPEEADGSSRIISRDLPKRLEP